MIIKQPLTHLYSNKYQKLINEHKGQGIQLKLLRQFASSVHRIPNKIVSGEINPNEDRRPESFARIGEAMTHEQ